MENALNPAAIAFFAIFVFQLACIVALIVSQAISNRRMLLGLDELRKTLSDEIRYAVAPKSIELSIGVNELVDLAVEIWRMEQRLKKSFSNFPENHRKGLEISIEKLKRYIEKYDLEIVDYTDQKFNEGLTLDILSVEKDPSVLIPVVKETIEPTILLKGQVVRKAKIILLTNQ